MKKNSFYTIGSLIILLICAFVFVILPAITGRQANQEQIPAFGKYGKTEIRYEQGSDMAEFVSNYGQMLQSYGQQIDSSTYYYIFNSAFNSAVTQAAYKSEVEKSGYKVPKSAVKRAMVPYFYDETGKYSSKLYKQTPASTIQELQNKMESNLTASRFYEDVFGSDNDTVGTESLYGMKLANNELDFLASFGEKKRGFDAAVFNLNNYPTEKVVEFGKENIGKFTKYDMSLLTCAEKTTAEKIAKRINNNEITFVDAVSEYSEKNYTNSEGKMNNSYQYQIENILVNKADIDVLANLSVGTTSDVIETNAGFSIFHIDGEAISADLDNTDTISVISAYIRTYENSIVENYFIAKANDLKNYATKSTFDEACEEYGITKAEIDPFPLNYGNVSIASPFDSGSLGLDSANTNEVFLKTAFSLAKDEVSSPMVIGNNVVVIKYTQSVDNTNLEGSDSAYMTDIENYDSESLQESILNSPKLENNFTSVYFQYFMN